MYMSTKEACIKWNISERRIRQLLQDGRIDGAVKVGNSWNIPFDAVKPSDKRFNIYDNNFIIDLDESYFNGHIDIKLIQNGSFEKKSLIKIKKS